MKPVILAVSLLLLAAAHGCHPKPMAGYLVPDNSGPAGYEVVAGTGVIENSSVKIAARQVRKGEEASPLLSSLLEKGYVIISLAIENTSGKTVIYKPNLTALTGDAFDFLRPLDYTDLYGFGDLDGLDGIKGRFYDLDAAIDPGGRAAKLLIFRPLSKNAGRASLRIDDLYIGTDTIRLTFPFSFKPEA